MRSSAERLLRLIAVVCVTGAAPWAASADTIYLKNGEKITASNVVEKKGRISYDTAAGTFSFPSSIVDKVIRDAGASGAVPNRASELATELQISTPDSDTGANDDVVRDAVRDHSINLDLLARLESEADANPSPTAIARVVAAERAAARFEIAVGDFSLAESHYRVALRYAPDEVSLLVEAAYLHLQRSEYSDALDLMEHAGTLAPESADVAKLTGWAYYGLNRLPEAVREWKHALDLRPDADVKQVLERAERDANEEANYRDDESAHFQLHNGDATPELARDILQTLEMQFDEISSALDYTPPAEISVTLYTNQAFMDITRAPSWVGALNDGRMRIPVEGLSSVNDQLAHVLKHELTHSFVTQETNGHCPVWLQEGIAQYMEGKRSGNAAASLIAAYNQHMEISLGSYEGSWLGLSSEEASSAYAWSLAVVEGIVNDGGMSDLTSILDRLADQAAPEDAVRAALHDSYADLMQSTVAYLRKTYVN